jgi:hypothetical protein
VKHAGPVCFVSFVITFRWNHHWLLIDFNRFSFINNKCDKNTIYVNSQIQTVHEKNISADCVPSAYIPNLICSFYKGITMVIRQIKYPFNSNCAFRSWGRTCCRPWTDSSSCWARTGRSCTSARRPVSTSALARLEAEGKVYSQYRVGRVLSFSPASELGLPTPPHPQASVRSSLQLVAGYQL